MREKKTKMYQCRFSEEMYEHLEHIEKTTNVRKSEIIRDALESHLGKIQKKPTRELDFNMDGPQTYYCDWRKTERTMVYEGRCEACRIRTYSFTDGENDPRGPLGDYANSNMYGPELDGKPVTACFQCTNDEKQYRKLLDIGLARWRKK